MDLGNTLDAKFIAQSGEYQLIVRVKRLRLAMTLT
jgi:hypothetical protein